MKTIITHISPHFDEIFAIWALGNFDPEFVEMEVKFKPTNPQGGEVPLDQVDQDPNILYLGIGRGKFDEHKLEKEEAANTTVASLVWDDIKKRGLAPQDPAKVRGVEKLLHYVVLDDLGMLRPINHWLIDYSLSALWSGFSQVERGDSNKKLEYGTQLMTYMYTYLTNTALAEEEIKNGVHFDTKWGKGVAVSTDVGIVPDVAYRQGYAVVVNITKKLGYHLILGKTDSEVDLTEAYKKAKLADPEADWYLHQSKRMLISGSHSAPKVKVSTLPLDKMIELVKI